MEQFEMLVPTYHGAMNAKADPPDDKPDFAEPIVPVLIRHSEGVRVVLGTHDFEDMSKPDIQIERRPQGWAIFLHPIGGGDPSGYVYFVDDGRSFLIPERWSADSIVVVDAEADVPLIDELPLPEPTAIAERSDSAGDDEREGSEPPVATTVSPAETRDAQTITVVMRGYLLSEIRGIPPGVRVRVWDDAVDEADPDTDRIVKDEDGNRWAESVWS